MIRKPAVRVPPSSQKQVGDSQESFAGGENKKAATNIAPLDQCAAMTNMRLVRDGELAKRPGLRQISSSLNSDVAIYPMTPADPSHPPRVLIGTRSAAGGVAMQVATLNGDTRSLSIASLTDLMTARRCGPQSAMFRDGSAECLYVGNATAGSSNGMIKYDGNATITEEVAQSKVTGLGSLWVSNQRLFGCKGSQDWTLSAGGNTETLYYSGLNNGDTINDPSSGGGSATIRTFGGGPIVGGFALGSSNFILHWNAISVFRGVTFDDINIVAGAGGVAPNIGFPMAWTVMDQTAYILTASGLYILTEGGGIRSAGTAANPDPIQVFLRSGAVDYSPSRVGYPWIILDNSRRNEVWCIVNTNSTPGGGGSTESRCFIYNTELQRFTGHCLFRQIVASACVMNDVTQRPIMVFTNAAGQMYATDFVQDAHNVFFDGGSAGSSTRYTSSVQLRRMYSNRPADQKSWRRAAVMMGSGAGETAATVGSATGATLSYTNSSGTVGDTTDLKAQSVNDIQLSGQGPSIDLTITDGGISSTGWSVQRVDVDASSLGVRGG